MGDLTPANNGVFYLLGDHLGSTSVTANGTTGALVSELRYKPWGETRYSSGTTPTSKHFTGQIEDAGIGLYFYGSRFYDPAVGRFTQADTIVPGAGNPQNLNRYAYVRNNPIRYTDPFGHTPCAGKNADDGPKCFGKTISERLTRFGISASTLSEKEQGKLASAAIDIGVALASASGGTAESVVKPLGISVVKSSQTCAEATGFNCWGRTIGHELTIYSDAKVSSTAYNRFLTHEIGHIFDNRIGPGYGSDELVKATFSYADGTFASGVNPATGIWLRTNAGYSCNDYPCQQHPVNTDGGQDPLEDFADMFLNWVYNSFDYSTDANGNGAGQARYNWVTDHMSEWLAITSNR
jgi:RHS repeat-associated protein